MTTCVERKTAVLVFARAPIPGETKTRLMPLLGAAGAARLQLRLIEHALSTSLKASIGPVQLWCSPDRSHDFFADCARRYCVSLRDQSGPSLGARMQFAVASELAVHDAVLVIGTDSPALSADHLQAAAQALERHDAVVHPAEDGGYVLLGACKPCPEAFADVDWGTERVFAQTMANFAASGKRVKVLETLWDVDLPADFERLIRSVPGWAGFEP